MSRIIFAIITTAILQLPCYSRDSQDTPIRDQIQTDYQNRLQNLEQKLGMLGSIEAGPCVEKLQLSSKISDIRSRISKLRGQTTITLVQLNAIASTIENLEGALRDIRKLDSRFNRIRQRVEEVNSMIQDLEGGQFQKMDAVTQRVTVLLEKAELNRQNCEFRSAIRIIEEIDAIGKKARNEIRRQLSDGRQAEKYIKRNEAIIEKAGNRIEGEENTRVLETAKSLHQKSKNFLSAKDFPKAWRAAVACRESLMDLARDVLTPEERQKAKDKVEAFYAKTQNMLEKAQTIAQQSGRDRLGDIIESAKKELDQARQLHSTGQNAKALLHIRKARRIAEKIISTAKRAQDISSPIDQLEKRCQRVARLIKDSDNKEAQKAYENALKHLEAAKAAVSAGNKAKAAEQARLAVRLLGKALHTGVKNNMEVAGEFREELQRVKEKVQSNLAQVKGSDNQAAQKIVKEALTHLSRAKALAAQNQFKKALRHLFMALSLSDKAVNLLNGRSNPDLEVDTDIEPMEESEEE